MINEKFELGPASSVYPVYQFRAHLASFDPFESLCPGPYSQTVRTLSNYPQTRTDISNVSVYKKCRTLSGQRRVQSYKMFFA